MGIFSKKPKPDMQDTATMPMPQEKIPAGMISLVKQAAVSLEKKGISGARAAVYMVADHSGSMQLFYGSGAMQDLAEKILGLSANLDDDGVVPVVFFESSAHTPQEVSLDDYQGWMQRNHVHIPWGSTNYVSAMDTVAKHYKKSHAADPALVIFQTDGEPDDRNAVERKLREYSDRPIFWFFIGFGSQATYLDRLPGLAHRTFSNVEVFQAGSDPARISASTLYDHISTGFEDMLRDARATGVLR